MLHVRCSRFHTPRLARKVASSASQVGASQGWQAETPLSAARLPAPKEMPPALKVTPAAHTTLLVRDEEARSITATAHPVRRRSYAEHELLAIVWTGHDARRDCLTSRSCYSQCRPSRNFDPTGKRLAQGCCPTAVGGAARGGNSVHGLQIADLGSGLVSTLNTGRQRMHMWGAMNFGMPNMRKPNGSRGKSTHRLTRRP